MQTIYLKKFGTVLVSRPAGLEAFQAIRPALDASQPVVVDFDGVLTDGSVVFGQDGYEMVRCSRRDSLGINMLQENGIKVIVISKEKNPVVKERCKKMGIECWQSVYTEHDKLSVLKQYISKKGISPEEICFVGDDVNDIPCIQFAGIGVTVSNGSPKNKKVADYVTTKKGGDGAVREVCDLILESR